jgi:hypothetical protein
MSRRSGSIDLPTRSSLRSLTSRTGTLQGDAHRASSSLSRWRSGGATDFLGGVVVVLRINFFWYGDAQKILGKSQQDRDVLAMDGGERSHRLRKFCCQDQESPNDRASASHRLRITSWANPYRSRVTSHMSSTSLRESRSFGASDTQATSRLWASYECCENALSTRPRILTREYFRLNIGEVPTPLSRMPTRSMAQTRDTTNKRRSRSRRSLLASVQSQTQVTPYGAWGCGGA